MFAFRLARESTGSLVAAYTVSGSRAALCAQEEFGSAFTLDLLKSESNSKVSQGRSARPPLGPWHPQGVPLGFRASLVRLCSPPAIAPLQEWKIRRSSPLALATSLAAS